jgi:protein-disulfide isomerase
MIKKGKLFLRFVSGFAAGLLVVAVLITLFFNRTPSAKQVADEAAQLKAANAKAIANLSAGQVATVRPIDKNDFLLSGAGGKVQLIVYLDFDCPFCRQYYQTLQQVKDTFGKEVTIAWRQFPLDSHPGSVLAAEAFDCAREQNKAEAMAKSLFDNQNQNANNVQDMEAVAAGLGLKIADFKKCLESEKYKEEILAEKDEAKSFGVIGTPTSFLDGRNLPGAYQFNDFTDATGQQNNGLKTLVDRELKK